MHIRDTWMVDHAGRVIAVWDGRIHGGTFATVKYARAQAIPLLQIDPQRRCITDKQGLTLQL